MAINKCTENLLTHHKLKKTARNDFAFVGVSRIAPDEERLVLLNLVVQFSFIILHNGFLLGFFQSVGCDCCMPCCQGREWTSATVEGTCYPRHTQFPSNFLENHHQVSHVLLEVRGRLIDCRHFERPVQSSTVQCFFYLWSVKRFSMHLFRLGNI